MKIGDHETHPAADVFPMMEGDAFARLVADISEHGLRQPIWRIWVDSGLNNGTRVARILDGRNRLRACYEACVKPEFADYDGDDPVTFVVSLNLNRRHLDESQRAMVAAKIANLAEGRPSKTTGAVAPVSQAKAGEQLDVSRDSVKRARKVIANAAPEIVAAVERGEVSVSAAASIAGLPVEKQREAAANGAKGVKAAAAVERERRKSKRAAPVETPVDGNDSEDDDSVPTEWDPDVARAMLDAAIHAEMVKWPASDNAHSAVDVLRMWVLRMEKRGRGFA